MIHCRIYSIMIILACVLPLPAMAGDEALYAKNPPANAAFCRVLNASGSIPLEVKLDGKKIVTLAPLRVSRYGYTTSGTFHFSCNGEDINLPASPKSLITLIWTENESYSVMEKSFYKMKKARLKIFNIGTPTPITLKTANGKTSLIDSVANKQYGFRDVNALTMPFAFYEGDVKILQTNNISLHKGRTTSLFLIRNGSSSLYVATEETR